MAKVFEIDSTGKKTYEEEALTGKEIDRVQISMANLRGFVYVDSGGWYGSVAWQILSDILLNSIWSKPGSDTKYRFYAQVHIGGGTTGVRLIHTPDTPVVIWETTITSEDDENYEISGDITIPSGKVLKVEIYPTTYIAKAGIYIINRK